VQACSKELSNATFFVVPASDHLAALARSDLVLPHVRAFLAELRQ
jgi:hypothetical protein